MQVSKHMAHFRRLNFLIYMQEYRGNVVKCWFDCVETRIETDTACQRFYFSFASSLLVALRKEKRTFLQKILTGVGSLKI